MSQEELDEKTIVFRKEAHKAVSGLDSSNLPSQRHQPSAPDAASFEDNQDAQSASRFIDGWDPNVASGAASDIGNDCTQDNRTSVSGIKQQGVPTLTAPGNSGGGKRRPHNQVQPGGAPLSDDPLRHINQTSSDTDQWAPTGPKRDGRKTPKSFPTFAIGIAVVIALAGAAVFYSQKTPSKSSPPTPQDTTYTAATPAYPTIPAVTKTPVYPATPTAPITSTANAKSAAPVTSKQTVAASGNPASTTAAAPGASGVASSSSGSVIDSGLKLIGAARDIVGERVNTDNLAGRATDAIGVITGRPSPPPWPTNASDGLTQLNVRVLVTVSSDGIPQSATVLDDPPNEFRNPAINNAMNYRFKRSSSPYQETVTVRFKR